jgi:nitrite reductase/ring-hydroxylating ferredoxin subunit
MSQTEVAKSEQVIAGDVHIVSAGGRSIALTRIDGKVCAFENKCPHLGLPLTRGKLEGSAITCPWHGSRFDVCSGRNLDWVNAFIGIPMPKWTHKLISLGKPAAPLRTIAVTENDGKIKADL